MTHFQALLGNEADYLLNHTCNTFPNTALHLPGPDFIDRVVAGSDRTPDTLRNFQQIFNTGRLAGTGYLSNLPVDQGVEHSGGALPGSSLTKRLSKLKANMGSTE